jgi:hypothetical protein
VLVLVLVLALSFVPVLSSVLLPVLALAFVTPLSLPLSPQPEKIKLTLTINIFFIVYLPPRPCLQTGGAHVVVAT